MYGSTRRSTKQSITMLLRLRYGRGWMRTRFDVRLRWWNREVLGLEGLGEVLDASEQLLEVLGL